MAQAVICVAVTPGRPAVAGAAGGAAAVPRSASVDRLLRVQPYCEWLQAAAGAARFPIFPENIRYVLLIPFTPLWRLCRFIAPGAH